MTASPTLKKPASAELRRDFTSRPQGGGTPGWPGFVQNLDVTRAQKSTPIVTICEPAGGFVVLHVTQSNNKLPLSRILNFYNLASPTSLGYPHNRPAGQVIANTPRIWTFWRFKEAKAQILGVFHWPTVQRHGKHN